MGLCDINGNKIAVAGTSEIIPPVVGARVCAIGDSNTQYMGRDLETYVKQYTGIESLRNFGYAGCKWETTTGVSDMGNGTAVGKVNQLIASPNPDTNMCTDYDIITIMLGTNCGTMGELTDTSDNVDTMCGAMRYCIEKLLYYYRRSRIGGIIPPQRETINKEQAQRNELIRAIYKEYSIPVLDLYYEGQMVPDSMLPDGNGYYISTDGTHLAGNGKMSIYRKYADFISRL